MTATRAAPQGSAGLGSTSWSVTSHRPAGGAVAGTGMFLSGPLCHGTCSSVAPRSLEWLVLVSSPRPRAKRAHACLRQKPPCSERAAESSFERETMVRNDGSSPATARQLLLKFTIATPALGLLIWLTRGRSDGQPFWVCLLASALFSALTLLLQALVERHGDGGWGWPGGRR